MSSRDNKSGLNHADQGFPLPKEGVAQCLSVLNPFTPEEVTLFK